MEPCFLRPSYTVRLSIHLGAVLLMLGINVAMVINGSSNNNGKGSSNNNNEH